MSFTPLYQNDTPLFNGTFEDDNGNVPSGWPGITLSNLSMHFTDSYGNVRIGTGTWSNLNLVAGTADYRASAADTGVTGPGLMYPVVQFSTGPIHFDPVSIVIINLS